MEISVYGSLDARNNDKALFKRAVLCPDTFDVSSFVSNMKAIFGKNVVIEILYV